MAGTVLVLALGLVAAPRPVDEGPPAPLLPRDARLEVSRDEGPRGYDPRRMRRTADGGYDYRDPEERFRARIEPDGSVRFRPGVPVEDVRLCVVGICVSRDGVHLKKTPEPMPGAQGDRMAAQAMEGMGIMPAPILISLSGRFGFGGRSPLTFSPRARQAFADATWAMRLEMARDHAEAQIRKELFLLDDRLREVWENERVPLARRKQILFQMWDDCEEGFGSLRGLTFARELDDLRVAAGKRARRKIVGFVRKRLPAGSPRAFAGAELARLNASRRSHEAFRPYARP